MGELLALIGSIFVLLAAIGVVRFDDVLARMHALSKASTLGVLLMLLGAAVELARPQRHHVGRARRDLSAAHLAAGLEYAQPRDVPQPATR